MGLLLVDRRMVIHGALKFITYRILGVLSNISKRYAVGLMRMKIQNTKNDSVVMVFRIRKCLLAKSRQAARAHPLMIPFSFSRFGR